MSVLIECVTTAIPLLPWNNCSGKASTNTEISNAIGALQGLNTSSAAGIHSYDEILSDIAKRAPHAQVVGVGYPYFYPAESGGNIWTLGLRCEGMKRADQRWINERINEINMSVKEAVERYGYLYADPQAEFEGHELCGKKSSYMNGLVSKGIYHPNKAGHNALGTVVNQALADDNAKKVKLSAGERSSRVMSVEPESQLISFTVRTQAAEVATKVVSPSGEVISEQALPDGVAHEVTEGTERFEMVDPEPGEWTIETEGVNVASGGEDVTIVTHQEEAPNQRPIAVPSVTRSGSILALDAGASTDTDGSISEATWYIEGETIGQSVTGSVANIELDSMEPVSVTLVVADDNGLTDFATRSLPAAQLEIPAENTTGDGTVGVTILSTENVNMADVVVPESLTWNGNLPVESMDVKDVNNDGLPDLRFTTTVKQAGLAIGDSNLCVTGVSTDDRDLSACVPVSVTANHIAKSAGQDTGNPVPLNRTLPVQPDQQGSSSASATTDVRPAIAVAAAAMIFALGVVIRRQRMQR